MDQLEIEVKFHLTQPSEIRSRILATGARSRGRMRETNIVFDDADDTLRRSRRLLRLRRDDQYRLTVKVPAPQHARSDFKVRREIEVTVSDFDAARSILNSLGYHKETVYEKWRETFDLSGAYLCLDTLPFGDFLEIEGPEETIRDLAARLRLDWQKRIVMNYHALFELVRIRENLSFTDITFDNFDGLAVDFTPCMPEAQAE